MTKIDEVTEARLVDDYKNGIFYKDIRRKYHLSHERLKRILQKRGVYNSRRPDYSAAPKTEIAQDYAAKTPLKDICTKYGISRDAIYDIVKETGVRSSFRPTAEQKAFIIDEYCNGTPVSEIADKIGFGISLIYATLVKSDIIRDRRIGVQKIDIVEAAQLYHEGMALETIGAQYGADRRAVAKRFAREGIKRKTISERCQTYSFNEHYFDDPNQPDVAYFLGFLWADGCNKTNANCVQLIVSDQDEDIVHKLKSALNSTHPIRHFTQTLPSGRIAGYCDFQITNQVLSAQLENLGMVRAKTYAESLVLPKGINHEMVRHFLRGLFDGDGWFVGTISNPLDINIGVAGHQDLLKILANYIAKESGINTAIRDLNLWNPDKCKTRKLEVSGNRNGVRFLQWLYQDSSIVRLNRKYRTYQTLIRRYFAEIRGAEKLAAFNFIHP